MKSKRGPVLWRTLSVCAAIALLGEAVLLAQSVASEPVYQITKVMPESAPVGGKVTLIFSGRVPPEIKVRFGGQTATVLLIADNLLYVVVPKGLEAGETPPITIDSPYLRRPENYLGFKVTETPRPASGSATKPRPPQTSTAPPQRSPARTDTNPSTTTAVTPATTSGGLQPASVPSTAATAPQPLKIASIEPPGATPGSTIRLYLSRPLRNATTIDVYLNTSRASSVVSGPDRSVVSVSVPSDTQPGDTLVFITEAGIAAPPFIYKIAEKRILGIRQSLIGSILAALAIVVPVVLVAYRSWRGRMRLAQLTRQYNVVRNTGLASSPEAGHDDRELPTAIPEPPPELTAICASGNCLLFAGPGLAAQSLLPTRYEALLHLIDVAPLEARLKEQLRDALRAGQFGFVTEVLANRTDRESILTELQVLYADDNVEISEAHKLLQPMPFAGVLTTGWDGLIEKTFTRKEPVIITGETDVAQMQRQEAFYIARLNGDLYVPESFVFSAAEYRQTLYERPGYARFVSSQVFAHPIFFVGMSLSGIEEFFDTFRSPQRFLNKLSYAIVPYAPLWEAQQERFRSKYGVELIGYPPTDGHTELVTFLRKLNAAVRAEKRPLKASEFSTAKLHRVQLTNIGPFDTLTLEGFQSGWTVLLGNNGSGKSTILRAIALGLCGEDPQATLAAVRLLRQGERRGRIELQVGDLTYVTDLQRDGDRTTIKAPQSPIQNGNWVVLGFPPLRGVSLRDPIGPTPFGASEPLVADLLPLVRGTIDTRLDSMKQWLVNLDVNKSADTSVSKSDAQRYARIVQSFYEILPLFTPGQSVSEGHVDRRTWQVYVKTEDGEVPIDNVSQGMSSIFGWVGTLLQRMYEIYRDAEDPTQQPALVLVDEIDAHLHPEWQQILTTIVKKIFPNVQIVATTHSPLLVAGMRQEELFIARRDPAEMTHIDVFPSPIDPEGLRADQILTSPIFGLLTTRGPRTNAEIKRYSILLGKGKDKRTPEEESEFATLQEKISGILSLGETPADRHAERSRREQVAAHFANAVNDAAEASDAAKEELRKRLSPPRVNS